MRVSRVTMAVVAVSGAAAIIGTATAMAASAGTPVAPQASPLTGVGPGAADRAAISYVTAHHPGQGTARVLATEPDTERGKPVYDVRVLAPDGATYEVHISRASTAVLWANPAENQAGGRPGTSPARMPADSREEKADAHNEDEQGSGDAPVASAGDQ